MITPAASSSANDGWSIAAGAERTRGAVARRLVLIVEDEPLIALELKYLVQSAGYTVAGIAADAPSALRLAEEHEPDLVLMDIRLSGGADGIDAAVDMRRRQGTPVIFISGHLDAETSRRARTVDPVAIVSKPFEPSELLELIDRFFS